MRWPVLIISALAVARRRPLLRWSAALGLVIALGAPAGALASADVETVHFGGSVTGAGVNPCTGAPGAYDVTFEGVSHTSIAANGSFHHTATVTGETVFTPGDPSQPTYTGKFTAWRDYFDWDAMMQQVAAAGIDTSAAETEQRTPAPE